MTFTPYEDGSYRIRRGWHNAPELTDEYEFTRLPRLEGQGRYRWLPPVDQSSVFDQAGEHLISLGGVARFQGQPRFAWQLAGLRAVMLHYLLYDAAFFDGQASALFTVMTWDRAGTWHVVWCTGYARLLSDATLDNRAYKRGYRRFEIEFTVERDAPQGPDVVAVCDHDDPFVEGEDGDYTITVTNQGDGATTGDVTVETDTFPGIFDFVSASGDTWTFEYFEDDSWVSEVTDPLDVTAVRAFYDASLAPGETAPDITITVNPDGTGNVTFSGDVTTPGDTNTDNDDWACETEVVAP